MGKLLGRPGDRMGGGRGSQMERRWRLTAALELCEPLPGGAKQGADGLAVPLAGNLEEL